MVGGLTEADCGGVSDLALDAPGIGDGIRSMPCCSREALLLASEVFGMMRLCRA